MYYQCPRCALMEVEFLNATTQKVLDYYAKVDVADYESIREKLRCYPNPFGQHRNSLSLETTCNIAPDGTLKLRSLAHCKHCGFRIDVQKELQGDMFVEETVRKALDKMERMLSLPKPSTESDV